MLTPFPIPRRTLARMVLALVAAVSIIAGSPAGGQEADPGPGETENADPVPDDFVADSAAPEPAPPTDRIGPILSITVLGDSLLAAPNIPPLRPGSCGVSEDSPVDLAARERTDVVAVRNLSCPQASLTQLVIDQAPLVDEDTDVVIVGGQSLEFDWPALRAACVEAATASADSCIAEAEIARARAANAFFAWRSLLRQIARRTPDASILVIGAPQPAPVAPAFLGSRCCATIANPSALVRSVFATADAGRRAVIESLADIDATYLPAEAVVAGDETAAADAPLVDTNDRRGHDGLLDRNGVERLAARIATVLPDAPPIIDIGRSDAGLLGVSLVLATDDSMADDLDALRRVVPAWYEEVAAGGAELAVSVVDLGPARSSPPLTSPLELLDALGAVEIDDAPSGADLVAALATVAAIAPPDGSAQHVVVWVDELHTATDEGLAAQLAETVAGLGDAEVRFIAPDIEVFRHLGELLTDTGAVIVPLADPTEALDALPTPTVASTPTRPTIRILNAGTLGRIEGQPVELIAEVDADEPVDAVLEWSTDGRILGTGERVTVDAGELDSETGVVTLTVTTPDIVGTAEIEITVSTDGDGIGEGDLCPNAFDPAQADTDGDGRGDACDPDDDGDHVVDRIDPCPTVPNSRLLDRDHDRVPDVCDRDPYNGPGADWDADDAPDAVDNCPAVPNRDQADIDGDGVGDVCGGGPAPECTMIGTNGDDVLIGTPGPDVICGLGGDDVLVGRAGDDVLIGGSGRDVLRGRNGDDRLLGGAGDDRLFGHDGADVLIGGSGDDRLEGHAGDDLLFGASGDDIMIADTGRDRLHGGLGDDRLVGGAGDDDLIGGPGSDTLLGREGADHIDSGNGSDNVRGGAGNDRVIDSRNRDTVDGGAGADLIGGVVLAVD